MRMCRLFFMQRILKFRRSILFLWEINILPVYHQQKCLCSTEPKQINNTFVSFSLKKGCPELVNFIALHDQAGVLGFSFLLDMDWDYWLSRGTPVACKMNMILQFWVHYSPSIWLIDTLCASIFSGNAYNFVMRRLNLEFKVVYMPF